VSPDPDPERVASSIQTTSAPVAGGAQAAIADASRKGFDLLWVGTEPGADMSGVVDKNVADVASGFDGHTALVFARGEFALDPPASRLNILIAVTGTAHSRRAAEVALALAQAGHGSVTALYVSDAPSKPRWRDTLSLTRALQTGEEAILKEMTDLAEQYGATLRPLLRNGRDPAGVIVEELTRGAHNLVVLGVTQRPGDTLSLGATARELLARSPQSVLLHAS
jgi:nucleotide-binding universal stress UspA family protein